MSNRLTNVNLAALIDMLQNADEIQIQGTPRVKIEMISWVKPDAPYYVLTAVGKTAGLRSVWTGTEWSFQNEGDKRLNTNEGVEYATVTDAYEAIAEARTKHPKYKAKPEPVVDVDAISHRSYNAYAASVGGKNYLGLAMPKWAELPAEIQNAWKASAVAVLHAPEKV